MDQTITVDAIGGNLVTITQGDSFVSTEISLGSFIIKAADIQIHSQTLPMVIPPATHMGKLEIWDSKGRLVYSWRSLTGMLVNTVHESSAAVVKATDQQGPDAIKATARNPSYPMSSAPTVIVASGQSNVNPNSSSSKSKQPPAKAAAPTALSSSLTVNSANGQITNIWGPSSKIDTDPTSKNFLSPIPATASSTHGLGSGTNNLFEGNAEASRPTSIFGTLGATDTATAKVSYTLHQPDRYSAITVPVKSWITTILGNIQHTPDGKVFFTGYSLFSGGLYAHAKKRTPNHHQLKKEDPMDLYGIQVSLRSTGYGACTGYKNINAIIADFDLIVSNTIECAGANDPMTDTARRLRLEFENKLNVGMRQTTTNLPRNKRLHPDSELSSGSSTVDGQPSATKQKTSNT